MTGLALAVLGVGGTLVPAILIGALVKRVGEARTALMGLSFGAIGYAGYALAPNTALFLAAFPLISLWGITGSPLQSLMSQRVSGSGQGQLQGAIGSLFGVAGMIGPLVFTGVFAASIDTSRSVPTPGAPFWLGSLLLLCSTLVAYKVTRGAALNSCDPR